jgi:hypothetical protein
VVARQVALFDNPCAILMHHDGNHAISGNLASADNGVAVLSDFHSGVAILHNGAIF